MFGHPLRLGILAMLAEEPRIVTDLVAGAGVDQAQVSKHLAILRGAGLLQCSPDGRCRVYSLSDAQGVRTLLAALESVGQSAGANKTRCARATARARATA